MWGIVCDRNKLLHHGFIRDEDQAMYSQDPEVFSYGGELFLKDDEDYFRVAQFCVETDDDAYYRCERIADLDNQCILQNLIDIGMVVWE